MRYAPPFKTFTECFVLATNTSTEPFGSVCNIAALNVQLLVGVRRLEWRVKDLDALCLKNGVEAESEGGSVVVNEEAHRHRSVRRC